MRPSIRLIRLVACTGMLLFQNARALTVSTGSGSVKEGSFSAAAIIEGNPAIA